MSNAQPTLGSLFDGSGGFPLAGALCGIAPVWASEIEPYPLRVTAARLPGLPLLAEQEAQAVPGDAMTVRHGAAQIIPVYDVATQKSQPHEMYLLRRHVLGLDALPHI